MCKYSYRCLSCGSQNNVYTKMSPYSGSTYMLSCAKNAFSVIIIIWLERTL